MSTRNDCIKCENYRHWLEIQLTDEAGHPLDNLPLTLKVRGTDKVITGMTDVQGVFRAEGLSARPLTLKIGAQPLADKLTEEVYAGTLLRTGGTLSDWCREQGYILSEKTPAGAFSPELPAQVYDMTPAQISRLRDYAARNDGYVLSGRHDHRRVIVIPRITEKVFAKSVLRGAGNTDAGTGIEMLDNFGRHSHARKAPQNEPAQAGFPLAFLVEMIVSAIIGGAVYSQTTQTTRRDDGDDFYSGSQALSEKSQRPFMLTLLNNALPIGVLMANYYHGDSLTYEDLAEKARVRGTATTRVRIRYQENTETGRPDVMSFATEGDNDQVRVRMGEKAPEYEAEEIRRSSQAYQSDGLPTAQSLASVYKFTLDDGHILYLGVGTDNKFVELTSSTHPDEFGGRGWHTGGDIEPVEVPSNTGNHNPYLPGRQDNPGGFQAHDDNGPVILTTPAPEDMDFNDYILITPVADIPAIYVYLSEGANNGKVYLSGNTIKKSDGSELISIPENADIRKLVPPENYTGDYGYEYKWKNEQGTKTTVRIHGVDTTAPNGSNASQGWIVRVMDGKKSMDIDGTYHSPGIFKENSPNYDPVIINNVHIPIETPTKFPGVK